MRKEVEVFRWDPETDDLQRKYLKLAKSDIRVVGFHPNLRLHQVELRSRKGIYYMHPQLLYEEFGFDLTDVEELW